MEKVNVKVEYPTGSITRKAVLTLESGVVEFTENPAGEIAHLSALGARGYNVFRVEEPKPEIQQDQVEEVTEAPVEEPKPSFERSAGNKNAKKRR